MERLKNMGLKKTFFLLSALELLAAFLLIAIISVVCMKLRNDFPSGGIAINSEGTVTHLEQPDAVQKRILAVIDGFQLLSFIFVPVICLAFASILFYYVKIKTPVAILQEGIEKIQKHELDFSISETSGDELGRICSAFETMRSELLKTNQELWRQMEERKRLNAAFSHDLRNPVTVLKGTVKLLRQNIADEAALDRLELYTQRIEQYVEVMSSIQRLEQIPVQKKNTECSVLHTELTETAKLLAPNLTCSFCGISRNHINIDHGLFLTVAENLIGNAARFAQSRLKITLEICGDSLFLYIEDDGPGYPAELLRDGPKPFGRLNDDMTHFGMGLYSSYILCLKHGGTLECKNTEQHGALAVAVFHINEKS